MSPSRCKKRSNDRNAITTFFAEPTLRAAHCSSTKRPTSPAVSRSRSSSPPGAEICRQEQPRDPLVVAHRPRRQPTLAQQVGRGSAPPADRPAHPVSRRDARAPHPARADTPATAPAPSRAHECAIAAARRYATNSATPLRRQLATPRSAQRPSSGSSKPSAADAEPPTPRAYPRPASSAQNPLANARKRPRHAHPRRILHRRPPLPDVDRSGEEPPSDGRDYAERTTTITARCKAFHRSRGITTRAA